ncbi:hypothetical protein [Nocardioides dongxiaopingii]|nr:hypothetical protein [Nocardioides dongxiaopingii]
MSGTDPHLLADHLADHLADVAVDVAREAADLVREHAARGVAVAAT